ncbi:MAG: translation initiation factor IF-2 [Anaerolineales bacterium]|nr:translation initiation factor IF-2 [Anaerolineales bacterium]
MSGNVKEKIIELPANITVRELAQRLDASPIDIIKNLMSNGVMANINQMIDFDTAAIVADEMGFEVSLEKFEQAEEEDTSEIPLWRRLISDEDPKSLSPRPPVVTILGHVDHGKTTLLDAIRHTSVASGEAGGITQHIGAYQISYQGKAITFLDTPGHAAFTAMRARGAQGADIVILVVAADDGVMPQTREAIAHAKAAKVPIIVSMNKMDKPNADPDKVKQQLSEVGLIPDDWDGDTIVVPMSAKKSQGLEDLLEAIILIADNMEINANPNGKVFGTIVEAKRDKSRGVIATILIQNGTIRVGDVILSGSVYGRIRAMFDQFGHRIAKAGPSTPVSVMGLNEVPEAGTLFRVVPSEKAARGILKAKRLDFDKLTAPTKKPLSLEQLFEQVQSGDIKELKIIIKADVQGSLEPIISSLEDLGGEIGVNILHAATGNIGENDVLLASASNAILIGFNVQADASVKRLAEIEGVSIRIYNIIYRLTEDIEKALKGMLEPEEHEVRTGMAEVLAVFSASKLGKVAGCKVIEGELRRNGKVRVIRNNEEIFKGDFASLKRHQDDVRLVKQGFECGVGIRGFNDYEVGDIIECFTIEKEEII